MIFIFLAAVIALIIYLYNDKYVNFVVKNSIALKKLQEINQRYIFAEIQNFDMKHSYDNEVSFDNISPQDYLIYQLASIGSDVYTAINNAAENNKCYKLYCEETKACSLGEYGEVEALKNTKKLLDIEKRFFEDQKLTPAVKFCISVKLCQTTMSGYYLDEKSMVFETSEILVFLERLKNKREDFYLDEEIWHAICRVERGKVSNRMRFSIYERDGYRCRKCGCSSNNLEIDHIFPISKGGKSTYNNLQTLCHECNYSKSNTLEKTVPKFHTKRGGKDDICELCGAPLVLRVGKYGQFYGCLNYPRCKFTKQL